MGCTKCSSSNGIGGNCNCNDPIILPIYAGAVGPTGIGIKGATGDKGDKGATGANGLSITGPTGPKGPTGTAINGSNGTSLLFNNLDADYFIGSAPGYVLFTNKTYTMPGSTLLKGGSLILTSIFRLNPATIDMGIKLIFGSSTLAEVIFTAGTVISKATRFIVIKSEINAIDSLNQRILTTVVQSGNTGSILYSPFIGNSGSLVSGLIADEMISEDLSIARKLEVYSYDVNKTGIYCYQLKLEHQIL